MADLFNKYGYAPDKEAIDRSLGIIARNLENAVSPQILKECLSFMDLTTLRNQDTPDSVRKLVEKVTAYKKAYPDYPLPASVCVYPNFASVVRDSRCCPELHVTTVSGCFPTSQSFLEVKMHECEMAVEQGADEIDIVLALNAFLCEDYRQAGDEIHAMRQCIDKAAAKQGRKVVLKVILETGLLVTPERIANASFLAMEEGADFIKTSTGRQCHTDGRLRDVPVHQGFLRKDRPESRLQGCRRHFHGHGCGLLLQHRIVHPGQGLAEQTVFPFRRQPAGEQPAFRHRTENSHRFLGNG